jgi:hypothetical protein
MSGTSSGGRGVVGRSRGNICPGCSIWRVPNWCYIVKDLYGSNPIRKATKINFMVTFFPRRWNPYLHFWREWQLSTWNFGGAASFKIFFQGWKWRSPFFKHSSIKHTCWYIEYTCWYMKYTCWYIEYTCWYMKYTCWYMKYSYMQVVYYTNIL